MSQNAPLSVPYLGNSLHRWKRKLHHF